MPKHKRWVLLANYYDKTALRNAVSLTMGTEFSVLEYTPRMQFVELFLNDIYMGTYQLGEHIKIDENRVNVTDDGYLLEVDAKAASEDITFLSPMGLIFNVKEPDIELDGEAYNFIKQYVSDAESTLYGEDFLNPESGYRKYLDIPSFVDWYLINEITKNNDAAFVTSTYMNLTPNGKLRMGPLWDYDIALGNINYNGNNMADGFWIKNSIWISRLFEDPEFVNLVKSRYKEMRAHETEIMQYINENASMLKWSVVENNAKWGTLYNDVWPNYAIWGSYENEVQYMKNWLHDRLLWLDKAIEEL